MLSDCAVQVYSPLQEPGGWTQRNPKRGSMDHTDQFMLDEDEDYQHHVELKGAAAGAPELETDAARLAQRQKQIDLGKNTQAYRNYLKAVPK